MFPSDLYIRFVFVFFLIHLYTGNVALWGPRFLSPIKFLLLDGLLALFPDPHNCTAIKVEDLGVQNLTDNLIAKVHIGPHFFLRVFSFFFLSFFTPLRIPSLPTSSSMCLILFNPAFFVVFSRWFIQIAKIACCQK